jgi:FkbM family methyltransferase
LLKTHTLGALGTALALLGEKVPALRQSLKSLGLRTSLRHFGSRPVSIRIAKKRAFWCSHVDESYLAFQLFWRGGEYYEPITRQLMQTLVQPGDTFIDIGAHIGFFSLVVGCYRRGVKVLAFEPNPKNYRILKANVEINALGDMTCQPIAISDADGMAELYLTESDMSASLMKDFQMQDTKQIESIEVRTRSLDSYLQQHKIDGPMIIKVDIEGHEPAFFRGAMETLSRRRPDIILEVLYDQDPVLVSWLKSLGYHFYPITDGGLLELDAPRLMKRFPFLFLNHWLSVRPKREVAKVFDRVRAAAGKVDLKETSEHFPPEDWPLLWQDEATSSPLQIANSRQC